MEYITILNYCTSEVLYKKLSPKEQHLAEDYIEELMRSFGCNVDECSWMFTSDRPVLTRLD